MIFLDCSYEGTPSLKDLPEGIVELLKINICVNSSYTSKLISVSLYLIVVSAGYLLDVF